MKKEIKYIIASVTGAILLASIVYGSLLPLSRSRRFIAALRSFANIQSIEQFKTVFDSVFNFYAPIGDEEIIKFLSNDVTNIIANNNVPEVPARALTEYIDSHLFKNDVRHLLTSGQMYYFLWKRFHGESDFKKAEEYFVKARDIGPKLPPPLYALLSLYREGGKTDQAKQIGVRILELWPADTETANWLKTAK